MLNLSDHDKSYESGQGRNKENPNGCEDLSDSIRDCDRGFVAWDKVKRIVSGFAKAPSSKGYLGSLNLFYHNVGILSQEPDEFLETFDDVTTVAKPAFSTAALCSLVLTHGIFEYFLK